MNLSISSIFYEAQTPDRHESYTNTPIEIIIWENNIIHVIVSVDTPNVRSVCASYFSAVAFWNLF
jgi:hypothetical protein